jgi:hypothetical protein
MFNKVISKSSAQARADYLERIRTNGRCFDVREDGKEDKASGARSTSGKEYREDAQKSGSSKDARERYLAGIKERWVAAGGRQ